MAIRSGQYQHRDWDVVDYEGFEIDGFPYVLRGPAPWSVKDREFGLVIGAAQSFGTLVRRPYAHMIMEELGISILNMSVGGSAPELFLRNQSALQPYLKPKFCIIQVLSARSSKSSYFESRDGKNMLRPAGSNLPFVPGGTAYQQMFKNEPEVLRRAVIGELRANWVQEMIQLIRMIDAPTILLWFSKRTPDIPDRFDAFDKCAGVFPQFVNRAMIDSVRVHADHFIECVTNRGMPHKLMNRFTGKPAQILLSDKTVVKTEDNYYPSPEMHEDVFAMIKNALPGILKR